MIFLAFRRLISVVAAAAGLAIASPARADIVIDTFTDPATVNYQINLLNSNPFTAPSTLLSNGLTRDLKVTVTSPPFPAFNAASGSIGSGAFSLNTDSATTAFATIKYSGFGAGTSDFTGGSAIRLDFTDLNPGNTSTGVAPDMPISVSIVTGTGTLTQTFAAVGGPSFNALLSFASFSGTGDLSNVTGLEVNLNSGSTGGRIASDFVLDNIVVPTNAVPAPPAFALLLAAAPVIALRRWKAKQVA